MPGFRIGAPGAVKPTAPRFPLIQLSPDYREFRPCATDLDDEVEIEQIYDERNRLGISLVRQF